MENHVPTTFQWLQQQEAKLKQEYFTQDESYISYFLDSVLGKRRGTKVDNVIKHIRKGCYEDSLPSQEMSVCGAPTTRFPTGSGSAPYHRANRSFD